MTELENKIYKVVAESNGIKGSDIAAKLGLEKREVNSTISRSVPLKALIRQDTATYKWHLISRDTTTTASRANTAPAPDKDLKDICNYYLHCISLESSNSVSQFLTSDFSLRYAVLSALEIDPVRDRNAINLLNKIGGNRDSKAYLGYPIQTH